MLYDTHRMSDRPISPDPIRSDPVRPQVGQPQDGQPQAAKPQAGRLDAGRPETVQPEVAGSDRDRFWETVPLAAMSTAQWEALCDRCGRCCLHKLRDDDERIHFTNVACRLLDLETAGCSDYARRARKVSDCVRLTPSMLGELDWLPPSCAYRLISDGKPLADWHPLVSGNANSVHDAGVSVRGRAVDERTAGPLEDHVVGWPGLPPRAPRQAPVIRRRRR